MSALKKVLINGILYTGISKYAGVLISLIITAVLSRLLLPEDFGIVAVAMVIITFFSVFSDLGIAPAVIQNKALDENDISNIFSFTVWLAIGISLLFFLCSGAIASFYDSPKLITICRLLSLNLFFNTLDVVPNAMLYKDKKFKFLAQRSVIVQSIVGVVAIVAALGGAGIYSLLINPVISSFIIFIITYRLYPQRFNLKFGFNSLQKILSFSLYQFFFNLINYFSRNLDKLLIGRYMGMGSLGYYEKSYRLMMLPIQNITHVITPVMHPVFSEFQNDIKFLESSYLKIIRLMAFIGFPLSVFLLFTSRELVLLIFGMQWGASVPVFTILALTVGMQIILSTSGSMFQAAGDTRSLFISGLFSATLNVAAILIGIFVFGTLKAVAWGIVVSFSINFFQCYLLMYFVTFKMKINQFFKVLILPLILSIILFLVFYTSSFYIQIDNMIISLLIKTVASCVIWAVFVQATNSYDIISGVKNYLKK
ncbi:MAG: lipopolysaccharide biosynthesis protein [Porphyromonadaceae bacterium]|nr:lipopolysaccharide biosynthesis protein [Porphyromonadaceae bacterium]